MHQELVGKDVKEPLCGWQWVYSHWHNLDGWTPTLELDYGGYRQKVTAKDTSTLIRVIKANKPGR